MPSPITRRTFLGTSMGILASLALYGCGGSNTIPQEQSSSSDSSSDSSQDSSSTSPATDTGTITEPLDNGYDTGIHHATIEVENFGTIKVELNANNTPITVSNFAQLVNDKFYDGLTFHRIIAGFMIQGGDPLGTGAGGASRTIKGEFIENGVVNAIQHKRGVISMARSQDYDSASSQFFIMHEDASHLDGSYAAFGKVTEGMDVVDAIATTVPVQDSNGTVAPNDQPRITSIRMDD